MDDARRFAQEFYDTLLSTGCADLAANAGRRALYRPDSGNWAIPASTWRRRRIPSGSPTPCCAPCRIWPNSSAKKPDAAAPFPIEVIRQWPDVSSKMETSPPGPRSRVLDAVVGSRSSQSMADVCRSSSSPVTTGAPRPRSCTRSTRTTRRRCRAPTAAAALRAASAIPADRRHARADRSPAPFRGPTSEARHRASRSRTMPSVSQQPFLVVSSTAIRMPTAGSASRRSTACSELARLPHRRLGRGHARRAGHRPDSGAAIAKDPQSTQIPILLVQLLSPSTVAQYLNGLGDGFRPLLASIQRANLFDVAGVPWLLRT